MLLILAVVFPMDVPKVTESLPFRIILKIPIKWKWFGMLKIRIIKCLMFVCQNVQNIIYGFQVLYVTSSIQLLHITYIITFNPV